MIKLPDELEQILMQAAEQVDRGYWTIGDITADLVDELVPGVSRKEVREYIGRFTRLAGDTIRDLEWMSRKIPAEKRTYNLSRHQYRACLGAGDKWEEYAQRAVESADDYNGMSAPVAVIYGWLKNDGAEVPDWVRRWERMAVAAQGILKIENAPMEVLQACAQVVALYNAGVEK